MPAQRRQGSRASQGYFLPPLLAGPFAWQVSEFGAWGQAFNPAPVGFQYGYQSDKGWWSDLADPPSDIGNALLQAIPNTRDLVWVDFTAYDIWPPE